MQGQPCVAALLQAATPDYIVRGQAAGRMHMQRPRNITTMSCSVKERIGGPGSPSGALTALGERFF